MTKLSPGDEVFGWCAGAFAEYASASEDHFVPKPANLTFEQAAAIGVSASTALQLLRDDGQIQSGQKVLVNGASGGVGTFAVQIAKAFGAEVTGVTQHEELDLVRSIGADHVIDYTKEDFTKGRTRYDLILDNVGDHSMAATRRALTPTGTLHLQRWRARGRQALAHDPDHARVDGRPPAGQADGQVPEPGRPGGPQGARRSREDHTGHRRHVPIARDAQGDRSCGGRARAGTVVIALDRPMAAIRPGRSLGMSLLRDLGRRKLRTVLTVLGITIGIWALVVFSSMANKINALVSGGSDFYAGKVIVTDAEPRHRSGSMPVALPPRTDRRPSMGSTPSTRRSRSCWRHRARSPSACPRSISGPVADADRGRGDLRAEPATGRPLTAGGRGGSTSSVLGSDLAQALACDRRRHGPAPRRAVRGGGHPGHRP